MDYLTKYIKRKAVKLSMVKKLIIYLSFPVDFGLHRNWIPRLRVRCYRVSDLQDVPKPCARNDDHSV